MITATANATDLRHYELFARALEYPDASHAEHVSMLERLLADRYPDAARELDRFCQGAPRDLASLQEIYTRCFEVQAITSLDVGFVLFGEDYKRGQLLANLSREHRTYANDCRTELGDHLPNVLRLLIKMTDVELREELIQELVGPAIKKMIAEFERSRLQKKDELYKKHHKTLIEWAINSRTLYVSLLSALYEVISTDFELTEQPLVEQTADFLKTLDAEMQIEESMATADQRRMV